MDGEPIPQRDTAVISRSLAAVAESLQHITVQVRSDGRGSGSGVIWRPDGLIITNAHVVRGSRAAITLWDNRAFGAQLIARDEERDLAALKVDGGLLDAATAGDSDALRVGDLALALGNPLGLTGALTVGIVHAIVPADRRVGGDWIQADVRLAPGNSGGPLANARGEVIGINSMITGGLALAVPSAAVDRFLQPAEARPFLGVITRPVAIPADGGHVMGLLILEVASGSPAEAAGLLVGDVLSSADGRPFGRPDALARRLQAATAGTTLRLDIIRGGRATAVEVQVAARQPAEARAA